LQVAFLVFNNSRLPKALVVSAVAVDPAGGHECMRLRFEALFGFCPFLKIWLLETG
jgi:hypothetical protein